MGIQNLLPFVDQVATDAHLRDFAGRTAAIDGYYWLHKGAKKCPLEMVRGTYATGFVDYCLQQVDLLAHHGVEALVVLDGAALPAKRGTEAKRRDKRAKAEAEAKELLRVGPYGQAQSAYLKAVNITPEHAFQLIQALRRKGVRYVVAPYEADAQIAQLARSGKVHLVLAEDSDMLAFGCPRVLTKLDAQGFGRLIERDKLQHARMDERDGGHPLFAPWAEWDAGRFLELCILAGCDYLESMHGVGIKSAYSLLRKHKTAEKVARFQAMEGKLGFDGGVEAYLHYFNKAKQTFLHQRVYDLDLHRVVPLTPPPEGAPPMPHCGADIDDALAYRLCELGDLSPDTHEPIVVPGLPAPQSQPVPQSGQPSSSSQETPSSAPAAVPPPRRIATTGVSAAFVSVAGHPAAAAVRPWGSAEANTAAITNGSSHALPAGGGKRPVLLKQSFLSSLGGGSQDRGGCSASGMGGFARASSFPAAQPPAAAQRATAAPAAFVPTERPPLPVQSLYSKRESKQPFKMPRPATASAPPTSSLPDSNEGERAPAARHVSGLKRSRFFQSAASMSQGSSSPPSQSAPSEVQAEVEAEEASAAATVAEAEAAARDAAKRDVNAAAVDEVLALYSFTPSAALTTRARRSASGGGGASSTGGRAVNKGSTGCQRGENMPPQLDASASGGASGLRSSPRVGLQARARGEGGGVAQELDLSAFAFAR